MISAEDFHKVEMRVGRIVDVQDYPEAKKPSYKLAIDFGSFGIKKSSAQLCSNYSKEELINRLVVAVTNFHPKQIGNFMSEVLVLGLPDEKVECVLLKPEREVELGSRVY
ncbi:MAG: tRNA-binding protein [Candidatus Aenigmarchaeota archaeon]|nr:tRNA-binding protein [Candidatus Aenigmarchaeota archaeon]